MEHRSLLTDYLNEAMALAEYEELEDGTHYGQIPQCWGVIAFKETSEECEGELRSVLEDWILAGLRWGDFLPVVAGINLNVEKVSESVEYV